MIFAAEIPSSVEKAECEKLAELAQGQKVLEVGSQWGRSTICLASVAEKVWAVDWHQGDFHAGAKPTLGVYHYNLDRYGIANVITIVGKFEEVVHELPIDFDGAFIDAAHDEDSVIRHYAIAHDLVKPGGWIAFHDYGRFGVTSGLAAVTNVENVEVTESLAVFRNLE